MKTTGAEPAHRGTLRRPAALVDAGLAASDRLAELEAVAARYAVAVTPVMAEIADPGDPNDPILRQFVPHEAELSRAGGERADPIGDHAHEAVKGLVHRYPDRVLLKFVNVCAVYCRFCFRREMVGPAARGLSRSELDAAIAYIAGRDEIWEVVVSGGDPLVAAPRRVGDLMEALAVIPHVKVVRFHTRLPIVAPERITADLVDALRSDGQATWVALHANHPREFTPAARSAIDRLVDAGIPLISQTVLLAGVNDDPSTLACLMRTFVECRVKPYYLHHGDLAPGTAHFRTTVEAGQQLMRGLRGQVSGLCQPTYVLDIPGGHGKSPIGPCYMHDDLRTVEDFRGRRHRLAEPDHNADDGVADGPLMP